MELGWCGTLFGGPGPDPGNQDRSFDRTTQGPGSLGPGPQFPRDRPQDHSRGPDGWERGRRTTPGAWGALARMALERRSVYCLEQECARSGSEGVRPGSEGVRTEGMRPGCEGAQRAHGPDAKKRGRLGLVLPRSERRRGLVRQKHTT